MYIFLHSEQGLQSQKKAARIAQANTRRGGITYKILYANLRVAVEQGEVILA